MFRLELRVGILIIDGGHQFRRNSEDLDHLPTTLKISSDEVF